MTSLQFSTLRAAYTSGVTSPSLLLPALWDAAQNAPKGVWISFPSREKILDQALELEARGPENLPLWGIPFAVKDNIDVEGLETTAACPAFAYRAQKSAEIVRLLVEAGAVVMGKTNLDQFATGLNGTRSPFGATPNAVLPEFIAGGSSSGSAVAVALGLVSFALGTDTAGSGRVPAALNNLVGLKPTRGVWSMTGVVPACRSLDTVSVFTQNCADASEVFSIGAHLDEADPFARPAEQNGLDFSALPALKIGVPGAKDLEFFGDEEYAALFAQAIEKAQSLGAEIVEIEFAPFLEAARLLYDGPWVAERFLATRSILESQPDAMLPVTRKIIERGKDFSAAQYFEASEQLAAFKKRCDAILAGVDCILTPTIPTGYTIEAVQNDPIALNSNLGFYTNFMNLLDYSALAVPAGFRGDGLPFGVTFFSFANRDIPLLNMGARWEGSEKAAWKGAVSVAVCGAHLSGLPLNWQLTSRGARLQWSGKTAPLYRFFALPGGPPFRPGLVRVNEGGASLEVEVWSVPIQNYGSFVAGIPSPLGIGWVELENGEKVQGFLCENAATKGARDITEFGSWRAFMSSQNKEK